MIQIFKLSSIFAIAITFEGHHGRTAYLSFRLFLLPHAILSPISLFQYMSIVNTIFCHYVNLFILRIKHFFTKVALKFIINFV